MVDEQEPATTRLDRFTEKVQALDEGELQQLLESLHSQLHSHKQVILGSTEVYRQAANAYYVMCDLTMTDSQVVADKRAPDLVQAFREFQRRGVIHFDDVAVRAISDTYIESIRGLKTAVDNANYLCDRLAVATQIQADLKPEEGPLADLNEALEAELRSDGMGGP